METRGWIYYRRKPTSGSGVTNALVQLGQFIEPKTRIVIEAKHEVRDGETDAGVPPI